VGDTAGLASQLVRDPQLWFDLVVTKLLGALSKHDPTCATPRSSSGLARRIERNQPRRHHRAAVGKRGP
jgi:tRNA U34 5-methylaminomethyl-2-thiouridine-forming methyltransferase MnmC